jgi:hypothetical protein
MVFCQSEQVVARVENKSDEMESVTMFRQGSSGNALGNRHHTRHLLNQRFLQALLLDFDAHGREAIEKCRKQSPLGYVKVLGHLVPRELKIEQNQSVKAMSDEQLEWAIATVQAMLEQRAAESAKLVERSTPEVGPRYSPQSASRLAESEG